MTNHSSNYNSTLLLVGILFIIWGILGLMDAKNYTYSGYGTDDNWSVNNVEVGSPAEAAGLLEGDVIKSTGGIAVTDTKALNKRERAKIGESRAIVIDRNGTEQTLQLTFAASPDKNKTNNMIGFIIGLLFIVLGLYANHKHKSALSHSFAVFSLCFGFLFMNGPYISSVFLGSIIGIISTAIVLFSFTALAIYMLRYTPESSFLSSKNYKLIYAPMLVILAIVIILQLTQMDSSGTLNMVMRLLFGAFIIVYFLIAVVTLIRKYMNASATDRSEKGLSMMLIGTVIGLLPILVYFTINTISPGSDLPGNDYVFYTFTTIPIFFTLALNKLNSASAAAE